MLEIVKLLIAIMLLVMVVLINIYLSLAIDKKELESKKREELNMSKNKGVVKNRLTTKQWEILNYLKENAVGKENAIGGKTLANEFGLTTVTVRSYLKAIRTKQDVVIGSNHKGYYIPFENEFKEAVSLQERKTISHIETCVVQRPEFILELYSYLNDLNKNLDKTLQNQVQMKLTGNENETYNKFGDKYAKRK